MNKQLINHKLRTVHILLIMTLVASCAPLPSTPNPAATRNPRAWSLFQPIDAEVRWYLANPLNDRSPEALDALAWRLVETYSENLALLREELSGPEDLSTEEERLLNYTVVREHIHKVWQEAERPRDVVSTVVIPRVATPPTP